MSDLNDGNSRSNQSEILNLKKDLFHPNNDDRVPRTNNNIITTDSKNPLLYNFNYNDQNGNIPNYEESHAFPLFNGIDDGPEPSYQTQQPSPLQTMSNGLQPAHEDFPNYNDLMNFPTVQEMPNARPQGYISNHHPLDDTQHLTQQSATEYGDYQNDYSDAQEGFIYQRNYFNSERRMSQDMERNAFYKPADFNTHSIPPKDTVRPLYYFDEYDANYGRSKKREKVIESSFAACEYPHRYCYICGLNGRMIVCQKCNSVAHLKCAKLKRASEQGWMCRPCMVQINKEALKYKEVLNSVNKGGQDLNTADVHLFKDEIILALDIPIELENLLIRLSNIEQTSGSYENN